MALLRPLSGSGAFGVMVEIMKAHGPDSFIGMLAGTLQGSTETTFYVLTRLPRRGARARRPPRAARLPGGDVAGFAVATAACHASSAERRVSARRSVRRHRDELRALVRAATGRRRRAHRAAQRRRPRPAALLPRDARSGAPATLIARVERGEDPAAARRRAARAAARAAAHAPRSARACRCRGGSAATPRAASSCSRTLGDASLARACVGAADAARAARALRGGMRARAAAPAPRRSGRPRAGLRRAGSTRRCSAYKASCFATQRPAGGARARRHGRAERDAVCAAFDAVAARRREARRSGSRTATSRARTCIVRAAPTGARLAMIDLQGALLAPPEYDLVCLLRDSYVELPDAEVAPQLADACAPRCPTRPPPTTFARALRPADAHAQGQGPRAASHASRARGDARGCRFAPRARCALRARARRRASRAADAAPRATSPSWSRELPERHARDDRRRRARHAAAPAHDAACRSRRCRCAAPARRLPARAARAPRRARGGRQRPPPARR